LHIYPSDFGPGRPDISRIIQEFPDQFRLHVWGPVVPMRKEILTKWMGLLYIVRQGNEVRLVYIFANFTG